MSAILTSTGLDIVAEPLGGELSDPAEEPIKPIDSWALSVSSSCDVIVTRLDSPLIASAKYGAGRLVLIGDSHFFRDDNLESEETGSFRNIRFLAELAGRLQRSPDNPTWHSEYTVPLTKPKEE